jgi:hypothetical protein
MPQSRSKTGIKIPATVHQDYICREEAYKKIKNREEDLIYKTSGNLPYWADSAHEFWGAAEKYRRVNGNSYRELTMSLQEEFTLEENIELIEEFMERTGISKEHVYTYAIHDKAAALDPEHRNIHCHLMFNERTLERDRNLSANQFFKRYTENEKGNPIGGYKVDESYGKRKAYFELRTLWADIINEKFKAKNMPNRVSEKKLKDQYKELIKQGDFEGAKLVDREPCKRLGKQYRNPKTLERIMEKVKEAEDYVNEKKEEYDTDTDDYMQARINNIAIDIVLRRLARELQRERELEQEENKKTQTENAKKEEEQYYNPYVITIKDLKDILIEKENKLNKEVEEQNKKIKEIRKHIIPKEAVEREAEKLMFGGEYSHIKHQYADLTKQHDKILEEMENINDFHSYEFDIKSKENFELELKREPLGEKLAYYKEQLKTDRCKAELNANIEKIKKENEKWNKEIGVIYGKKQGLKKQKKILDRSMGETEGIPEDTIIYSEKIPKQLMRNAKLYGTVPLKDLSYKIIDTNIYYIVDDENLEKLKTVKLGDDIINGKVHVYTLEKNPDEKTFKVEKTDEEIPVYKQKKQRNKTAGKNHKPYKEYRKFEKKIPKEKEEKYEQKAEFNKQYHANSIVDRMMRKIEENEFADNRQMNVKPRTNDYEYEPPKNEAEKAQKTLDDWSRGLGGDGGMEM